MVRRYIILLNVPFNNALMNTLFMLISFDPNHYLFDEKTGIFIVKTCVSKTYQCNKICLSCHKVILKTIA